MAGENDGSEGGPSSTSSGRGTKRPREETEDENPTPTIRIKNDIFTNFQEEEEVEDGEIEDEDSGGADESIANPVIMSLTSLCNVQPQPDSAEENSRQPISVEATQPTPITEEVAYPGVPIQPEPSSTIENMVDSSVVRVKKEKPDQEERRPARPSAADFFDSDRATPPIPTGSSYGGIGDMEVEEGEQSPPPAPVETKPVISSLSMETDTATPEPSSKKRKKSSSQSTPRSKDRSPAKPATPVAPVMPKPIIIKTERTDDEPSADSGFQFQAEVRSDSNFDFERRPPPSQAPTADAVPEGSRMEEDEGAPTPDAETEDSGQSMFDDLFTRRPSTDVGPVRVEDERLNSDSVFSCVKEEPKDGSESRPVENTSSIGSIFFEGRDGLLKRTEVEKKLGGHGIGLPDPKLPKVAHYNQHNPEDEIKYVAEHESTSSKLIPGHREGRGSGSEGEDEQEENDYSMMQGYDENPRSKNKLNAFKKYDFKSRKIDSTRLAVYSAKERILNAIENHRVVIVDGFTGCGKTTQVPQFILDSHYENEKYCNIIVTQPRRIAAISVAKRVCHERGWEVGKVVGYQVGMESKKDQYDTMITYMTTGVLLQRLISRKNFKDISHIIIDEVHERDLESDLLLLVIKKIMQDDKKAKNRHVKLILMSATLNARKFSRYFPTQKGDSEVEECPVVKIPHTFRHRVDEVFLDSIIPSSQKELYEQISSNLDLDKATIPEETYTVAVDCVVSLDEIDRRASADPRMRRSRHKFAQKRGSILIFLPGMEEIHRLVRSLNAKNKIAIEEEIQKDPSFKDTDYYKWDIVPLHSLITNDEQQRVFDQPKDFRRKIILSTNIAESSVTVPDIVYVIDFCLTKSICIDPYTNFTTLRMVWASVSQCIQRKGRTGRVCDGKVFRLVPKSFFSSLPQDSKPEMLRANLETVVLQLKKLELGSPKELLAMALDPPAVSGIERAVANLKELGALTIMITRNGRQEYDTCDGNRTFMGQVMTDLPIPQQCTRLIMLGHCFGVMREAVIIASALSVKNPFSTPFVKSLEAYDSRLTWAKKSCSDVFALYYVYKHWVTKFGQPGSEMQAGPRNSYIEKQWARGSFVQLSVLREIKSTVELIEDRLVRYNLASNPLTKDESQQQTMEGGLSKEAGLMLKMAIAGAFYPNYFHRKRPDLKTYEREKSREVCGLDLFNTVFFKGFPPAHNGKVYAKHVADFLSYGLTVPSIKFDGQKVLASFDTRGEKIGPISKGVYRAIKRRQIRNQLEFDLAPKDLEERAVRSWERRHKEIKFTPCPPLVQLPPVDVQQVYVRVTHIENPGQFWVVYSKNTNQLDAMVERIQNEIVHVPISSSKLVPNALCLAPYCSMFYRAKVLIVSPRPINNSLVYFVDYGNTAWVSNNDIVDFTPSMVERGFHTFPCLAIECRLSTIKPATIHGAGWHERAIYEFKMFSEKAPFIYVQIYSVSKNVVAAELVGHDDRRVEKNMNEILTRLGYAEPMDEPTYSEYNHKARQRVSLQDRGEKEAHNKEQIGEQLNFDFIDAPRISSRESGSKVTLKGPWSPLELDFQSLCHSSNTKQVKIENNSVNSVVLDTEPTAPISRLMVAASVGIQDRSGSVVARDTTMMPSVPGLLPLLAMLFAPQIELRVDIRQTKYTGVLCGLGTAPNEPDLPIYPDHDVEIVFDTNVDDEDIDSINRIRYLMNLVLRNTNGVNMSHYQNSLYKELMSLLKRTRPTAEEEVWPQEEYVWNRIDQDSLNLERNASFIWKTGDIFVQHHKVLLNEEQEGNYTWNFAI